MAFMASLTLVAPAVTAAQELGHVGQRLKVTARRVGTRWTAVRLQERNPRVDIRRGQVEGRVDSVAVGYVVIGPVTVQWDDSTRFVGIRRTELREDVGLEVAGVLVGPGVLLARTVEHERIGRDRLTVLGAVSAVARDRGEGVNLTVLGVNVLVPDELRTFAGTVTRDPDDRRPEDQLTVRVLGRPLTVGGEISQKIRGESDPALRSRADDRVRLDGTLKLEFFYRLGRHASMFVQGDVGFEAELYREAGTRENTGSVRRGQAWVYVARMFGTPFALQVGRQRFREKREWWWDEDLDAVRLRYVGNRFVAEVAVAQEVAGESLRDLRLAPEHQDLRRVLGNAAWAPTPEFRLDLFGLWAHDRSPSPGLGEVIPSTSDDEEDANLVWFGTRFSGDLNDGRAALSYWIDGAVVRGRDIRLGFVPAGDGLRVATRTEHRVVGWATDLGMTWTPSRGGLALTVSYAAGSGDDDPADGTDHAFRQTGLQDNNGRYEGVDRFRYYGELLRPELSNLEILSTSIGLPLLRSSSIELLYHRYSQIVARSEIVGARLKADPAGLAPGLGEEIDLALGLEEWEHLEMELIAAAFRAGRAFAGRAGELTGQLTLKVDWNF